MNPMQAVYEHLAADEAVAAIVGTRIYTMVAPQSSPFPRVTIQQIAAEHFHHMTGASGAVRASLQVDAWALDSLTAWQIGEAIREALQGRIGALGESVTQWVGLDGRTAEVEQPDDASETWIHRVRSDYTIWHAESVPSHED